MLSINWNIFLFQNQTPRRLPQQTHQVQILFLLFCTPLTLSLPAVIASDLVASLILAYMQAIDNTYPTPHMLSTMWPVLRRQRMIWEHPLRVVL